MRSRLAVPFLMYHAIRGESTLRQACPEPGRRAQGDRGTGTVRAEPVEARTMADPVYTVSLADFEQQLAYLHRAGFQAISLAQFQAWHHYGDPLPPKPIVLTFDDGDPSHHELVLPRLMQYRFCGVFAVVPSWIGTPRSLSVEQLRGMQVAGMEIISHGMHHLPLTDLGTPQLREELVDSRRQLEVWLGKPVHALAIPRGFCSVRVRQVAYEGGYQLICTSRPDRNFQHSDPYNLARFPIKAHLQLEEFSRIVQAHPGQHALGFAGYWVRHSAQRVLGPKRYDRLRAFLLRQLTARSTADA